MLLKSAMTLSYNNIRYFVENIQTNVSSIMSLFCLIYYVSWM